MSFKSILPRRSNTVSTNTTTTTRTSTTTSLEEDAIPDSDYKDTTNLLIGRLQAWKQVCGCLEDYMSTTMKVQRSHAKELERVFKTVSEPVKEEHHFNQGAQGIAGLMEVLRRNTQGLAEAHADAEKRLKQHVVPVLELLHSEIKSKAKELGSGAIKHGKEVSKSRALTQKHIELLGQYAATFETSKARLEAAYDPYVLSRGVTYRLARQVADENLHFQEVMAIQNSFPAFESHVVEQIQRAFNEFFQCMGAQTDAHRAMYTGILNHSSGMPGGFEWANFFERNDATLLDPKLPPRDIATIKYANQEHTATKPLVEGILDRKSRAVMRGYTGGYFAVTPAGYLHGFKENDDTRHEPTPDISLYLPECVIGVFNGGEMKFSVKGKDLSGGKVGFHMTSEFNFKARTRNDFEQWQGVLGNAALWSGSSRRVSGASPVIQPESQPESQPVEPETTPLPTESKALPVESKALPVESKALPVESKAATEPQTKAVPMFTDTTEPVSAESKAVPTETNAQTVPPTTTTTQPKPIMEPVPEEPIKEVTEPAKEEHVKFAGQEDGTVSVQK